MKTITFSHIGTHMVSTSRKWIDDKNQKVKDAFPKENYIGLIIFILNNQ